jgi:hypothetical protein
MNRRSGREFSARLQDIALSTHVSTRKLLKKWLTELDDFRSWLVRTA